MLCQFISEENLSKIKLSFFFHYVDFLNDQKWGGKAVLLEPNFRDWLSALTKTTKSLPFSEAELRPKWSFYLHCCCHVFLSKRSWSIFAELKCLWTSHGFVHSPCGLYPHWPLRKVLKNNCLDVLTGKAYDSVVTFCLSVFSIPGIATWGGKTIPSMELTSPGCCVHLQDATGDIFSGKTHQCSP